MRHSVSTLRGDSRPYLRFAIFAIVTLIVLLTISGCAGTVGSSQSSTGSKTDPTSITTTALAAGTTNVQYSATFAAQGGALPYTWSITSGTLPAGIALTSSTGTLAGIPTVAGTASFVVKVTDSSATAQTSSESFTLAIEQPEAVLAITTTSLPAGGMRSNYSATLEATGGTIPYTWSINSGTIPSGLALGAAGVISGAPTTAGTFSFVAEVADSASPQHTATKSFSVQISAAAAALEITTTSLAAGRDDTAYSATLGAAGGETPYTWTVASGTLPTGLTLTNNGVISGTPTTTGTSAFTAAVRDSSTPQQTATRAMLLTVSGTSPTEAPLSITTATLAAGKEESAYTQGLGATGGKAPYTWSVAAGNLPSGLTMTTAGMISGTPSVAGSFAITAEVQDDSTPAQTAEKTYILTVATVIAPAPLSITTTSLTEAMENLVYSTTLAATGGTKPYTWTKAGGSLPAGVALGSSGILTGAPTVSGSFQFLAEVQDTSNPVQTASQSLTLVVAAPTPTLSITTTSIPNGTVNSSYVATLGATGGLTPYTWSLASGALPTGVSLSSTGVISGTPKTSGTYTIGPKVTDSEATPQTATKQFTFTITAAVTTLAISTTSVPAGKVGTAYSTTLAATGGTTPYSWSLAAGALPSGVSISSTGTISGTPTASGSFTFVAEVTDSGSPAQTAQMTYSLSVSATTSPVSITTASLAAGKVGTVYSATLGATGGTTPYKWSITSGSLNAGLTLSSAGVISGTPTTAGTASFTVEVTDSSSPALTATQTFSLVVAASAPTPPTITTFAAKPTSVSEGGTSTLSWSTVGATEISITPGTFSSASATGTTSVTPLVTTTYTLTATNTGGSVTAVTTVTVQASTAPTITSFAASPSSIASGSSSTLSWVTTGASTIAVTPGTFTSTSASGSTTVSPLSTTTYTLTATNTAGTVTSTAAVTVTAATATGTPISSCQTLSGASTTYYLTSNVSATETCMSIQNTGITLNLNGYTITYGTNMGAYARFGISGIASWDPDVASGGIAQGAPAGGTFDNFTLMGPGSIVEATGVTAEYAHAIRFGQGLNSGPTIYGVIFTWSSNSAMGIYLDYAGVTVAGGPIIHDNTFNNNVTAIVSRYNLDGMTIDIDQANLTTSPAVIYDNTILGGPQGGIDVTGPSSVYQNTIKQGTVGSVEYTDDFCIYELGASENVYNNTCEPTEGRGMTLDGVSFPTTNSVANTNTIVVTEIPNNSEYSGCELDGAYVLEVRNGANNATDEGTNGTAYAKACDGFGLRISQNGVGDTSTNSTFSGLLQSGFTNNGTNEGVFAAGLSLNNAITPTMVLTGDTFIGDTSSVFVDWVGSEGITCVSCTLGSGPEPSGFTTFYFWNGGGPAVVNFQDTTFTGSATKNAFNMSVPMANGQTAQYFINWTYSLTVNSASTGAALSGATVLVTNAAGATQCNLVTNSSGQVACVLTDEDVNSNVTTNHNPYTVTVTSGGTSTSYSLTITSTTTNTISF